MRFFSLKVFRVKVCFSRFFLWFNQNKRKQNNGNNNTTKVQFRRKNSWHTKLQPTKGKSNRQSSSLNGLNLITALFCIILVCVCVCVRVLYTTMSLTYCMENERMLMKHLKNRIEERLSKPIPLETIHTYSTIAAINFHIRWDIDHRLHYVPRYEMCQWNVWMLPCALNEMCTSTSFPW